MQTTTRRGRAVKSQAGASPLRIFYIVLGLAALIGITVVATATLGGRSAPAATARSGGAAITTEGLPARGQTDAPVTVIEYADFQCPACNTFFNTIEPGIVKDYIDTGKLRFVFHDFPLSQHRNAIPAAEAARCAADQGAFWGMHDLLFANQGAWSELPQPAGQFIGYADQLKLDRAAFQQCLSSHTSRAAVLQAQRDSIQANIQQTPTFVIDGRQYLASDLPAAIAAALAATK